MSSNILRLPHELLLDIMDMISYERRADVPLPSSGVIKRSGQDSTAGDDTEIEDEPQSQPLVSQIVQDLEALTISEDSAGDLAGGNDHLATDGLVAAPVPVPAASAAALDRDAARRRATQFHWEPRGRLVERRAAVDVALVASDTLKALRLCVVEFGAQVRL